jgi:hypothetical protein
MHLRSKHSSTADHRRVTSGTGTGSSEPRGGYCASVRSGAAGPPHAQPPHELVERALATAITGVPDAPKDFGPREVRIFAQPLRDPRLVGRHGRRAPGAAWSRNGCHLARAKAVHGRTRSQIRYRDCNSRKISHFCGAGQELAWRVSDRTDHSRASAAWPIPERSVLPQSRGTVTSRPSFFRVLGPKLLISLADLTASENRICRIRRAGMHDS